MNHNTFRCGCGVVAPLPHAKARSYGAKCEACARKQHAALHVRDMERCQRDAEGHAPIDRDPTLVARMTDLRNRDNARSHERGMVAAADNVYAKQREAQYAALYAAYGDAANLLDACDAAAALCSFAAKLATPVDYLSINKAAEDAMLKELSACFPRVVSIGTPPRPGSIWEGLNLPEYNDPHAGLSAWLPDAGASGAVKGVPRTSALHHDMDRSTGRCVKCKADLYTREERMSPTTCTELVK